MISNFIPDSLCCLYIMTDSEKNLFSSRLRWIQRPMKSIEIFPLPMLSFWSCHNFILQRVAPSHHFFSHSDTAPSPLSMPPFSYFFQKILSHFFSYLQNILSTWYNCTWQRSWRSKQKNFILNKRQTSHLLGREKRRPLYSVVDERYKTFCCPKYLFYVYILNEIFIYRRDICEFYIFVSYSTYLKYLWCHLQRKCYCLG